MNTFIPQNPSLIQIVLASCIFVPTLYANPTNPGNTAGPITTANFGGSIEVLPVSKITGTNANAIDLNTTGGQVIIDANNTFAGLNAVYTTGAATESIGVNVINGNSKITVNVGSGINAENTKLSSDGIFVDATGVSIDNAGTVRSANFSAIHLSADASQGIVGTSITNRVTGIITNSAAGSLPVVSIDTGGLTPGLFLSNEGKIESLAAQDAIRINSPFMEIINKNGGIIQQNNPGNGNAITLGIGATSGNISNQLGGTMAVNGAGNVIIINDSTTGNVLNAGTMMSVDTSVIVINNNMTSSNPNINNTGAIETASNGVTKAAILLGAGTILSGDIYNSGSITNIAGDPTSYALNLQNGQTTLFNTGNITGTVLLPQSDASGGGDVFFMMGGTINGNITAASSVVNTLQFDSGQVLGTVMLGSMGDTLNLVGSDLKAIVGGAGADTYNVSGGGFTSLDGGLGNDILNIEGTFIANGTITNIPTINVNNGILTVNQPITNMTNSINIIPGASMIFNTTMPAVGTGSIQNNGFLSVTANNTVTTNGAIINSDTVEIAANAVLKSTTFTQNANGAFEVEIQSPSEFGQIQTTGIANVAGTINPQLNLVSFIPSGTTFDVVKTVGGLVDTSTLVQPNSLFLSFIKSDVVCGNNCIRLTALTKSFLSLTGSVVTQGVATTLDVLSQGNNSPFLNNLILQFQSLNSPQIVEKAMQSLTPPFNYGLVAGSNIGMESNFTSIFDRLYDLHMMFIQRYHQEQGGNRGDPAGVVGAWVKPYGAHLHQNQIQGIDGYRANAGGLAVGLDWGMNDYSTIGIAGSFTKAKVDDQNVNPKDETIKSWQGTLYGWFDLYKSAFLDAMFGISQNHYDIYRNISVGTLQAAAQSHFTGMQYGFQADFGWFAKQCAAYYFSPVARLKYLRLDLNDYTEGGAGGVNLSVNNHDISQFQAGIGFRTGTAVYFGDQIQWISSFFALISYDFDNDGEQTVADFLGGGPAFATPGITPKPTIYDIGLALTRNANQQSTLSLKYDLQLREKFFRNAAYVEYYILW